MATTQISNRLHRSGAIDFNVEFATRQADINLSDRNPKGKRIYSNTGLGPGNDALSVCEGEPLYYTKRARGNQYSSVDSCRNPINCLSSFNGYVPPKTPQIMEISRKLGTGVDLAEEVRLHSDIRDLIFLDITYVGIAVSKWAYERLGHQQDQFVATRGGQNTFYVDEEVNPGDTLVVDIAMPDEDYARNFKEYSRSKVTVAPHGFARMAPKKGCPKSKVTLIVRSLPNPEVGAPKKVAEELEKLRDGFYRRGQVIGKCITGAKRGERCDAVLEANALGIFTHHGWKN